MRQLNLPTRLVAILEDNKPATAGASRANRPLKTLRVIPISLLYEDSGCRFSAAVPSRTNRLVGTIGVTPISQLCEDSGVYFQLCFSVQLVCREKPVC